MEIFLVFHILELFRDFIFVKLCNSLHCLNFLNFFPPCCDLELFNFSLDECKILLVFLGVFKIYTVIGATANWNIILQFISLIKMQVQKIQKSFNSKLCFMSIQILIALFYTPQKYEQNKM